MKIGTVIMNKRKALGYTQQTLADKLNVSFQAVSKWENGTNYPEMEMLPMIASVLDTSIDSLLGYKPFMVSDYDKRYDTADYYWGITPNNLCYEIMKLRPPIKPLKVLDIGCGEGKDAVFLARNGYIVTAFDLSEAGIEKGKKLAEKWNTHVDFFKADITDFRATKYYDIIFSSGVFHMIKPEIRKEITANLKECTNKNGIHAINVFVEKPFVSEPPDKDANWFRWNSGELFMLYYDWKLHKTEEIIFDCNSGGIPHQHCMDIMIAERVK
ncbi:methyltransferase domain-containing protein [Parablautia muri]|nr:methyltransferase domain-containing protein [Parablautia muri]